MEGGCWLVSTEPWILWDVLNDLLKNSILTSVEFLSITIKRVIASREADTPVAKTSVLKKL